MTTLATNTAHRLTTAIVVGLALLLACGTTKSSELRVTSFSPSQQTGELETSIQIQFDRPAVNGGEVGMALASAPVVIEPAVEVAAHWIDRQTLVVVPQHSLLASTRYKVALAGELSARAGGFEFEFVNRPLVIEGVWGVDLARLPAKPELPIHFNQPVAAAAVVDGCRIEGEPGSDSVALTTTTAGEAHSVVVIPATALARGQDYTMVCTELVGAGGDTAVAEPYLVGLHTYPGFEIAAITPSGYDIPADDVDVDITFSTPVNLDQVRDHFESEPAVAGLSSGTLDRSGTRYRATVNLDTETRYTFTVRAGLRDIYNQKLAESEAHTFYTGDARPRLTLETGIYAVEPAAQGYPVWTRNVGEYEVECARVGKPRLVELLTSGMDYDPWYDAADAELDWKRLELAKRATKVKVEEAKNKWHLDYLELDKLCGEGGKRGLFLAALRSSEVEIDADNPWRYRPSRRVLANVTDLGILLKVGTASGLVWVTSITSGKPVAGAKVSLYTPQGRLAHQGSTGSDGILSIPGSTELLRQPGARDKDEFEDFGEGELDSYRSQRLIAVVEKGAELGVVDGNWANGIQTWNFGVREDRRSGETRIRGFIQSDRGIYRPGERVHFKGLAREIAVGKTPAIPRRGKVAVVVEDSRGATVFNEKLTMSKFGGFAFDFDLGAEANLGDYHVRATIDKQTFRERFMVEEFRKVSYAVDIEAGRRHARLGDKLSLDVDARYLFGAPVSGARVEWNLQRRPHHVGFAKFAEYQFTDNADRGYYYWDSGRGQLSYIADGEGVTGKDGHFRFGVRDPRSNFSGPQDYLIHAAVTDATDQTVSKQAVVTAHQSDFYLGLHTQEFVQAVGMPFSINAVAVDPHGRRVATAATLSMIRVDYECSFAEGYRSYQRCHPVHKPALRRAIEIPATATATERIMPEQPGEYIIRIEATDNSGAKVSTSGWVWILGKGEAFWSGDESARMTLIASQERYRPGETARLVPRTNLKNATALVTLERNGVLSAFVKELSNPAQGIEISLDDLHAPNVYASVAMVSGRSGAGDRHRPRFKMGITELSVSTDKQRLRVAVTTARPSYQPGDTVTGVIKVSSRGQPVSAEVSLSVADEGVLQLIAYKTPDPMQTFYASWGLGTDAATNWNRIARLNDPAELDPDEGGDGGADDSGQQIRSRFVSSALWRPSLVTDERGEIAFSFVAPDNLTAFRLMAVAADTGSRFGSGEHKITIAKPLLAKPVLPRFLTAGDYADVGVVVHNYTGSAGRATVSVAAAGARLGASTKSVDLAVDGSARVSFRARTLERKQVKFTFSVKMASYEDALEVAVPVNRALLIDNKTLARGELAGGKVEVALDWDKGVLPADSALTITVDRTGLAELEPSLRYLVEYPYGCLEQTLSRFVPLTKVEDLAGSLGIAALRGPKLATFIRAGAAKVVRHQHGDGHYSLWPSGPTYPHLTVYATYGLSEAKRAGVAVDDQAIARGLAAMRKWANSADRKLGPNGESATVAMAAYLLADADEADHGLNARLYRARAGLPTYGQAFLLRALHRGQGPADQVATLTGELVAAATIGGGVATVGESVSGLDYYMSSDVRSTAIVLSALLEIDPQHQLIDKLVAGLRAARGASGRWRNTQDNLYALVALADYARGQAGGEARIDVAVAGRRKPASRRIVGNKVVVMRYTLAKLEPGKLIITSDSKVRYSVRLSAARADVGVDAVDRGFAVTRQYLDPGTDAPLSSFTTGELVKVKITVSSTRDRAYVALVDRLPAGFEPVNSKLATSQQQARASRGYRGYGYRYRYGWTHRQLRDDRVEAFADRMRAGTMTLEYLARATIPGKFKTLPASAEAMYEPEINGRSRAQIVAVKP